MASGHLWPPPFVYLSCAPERLLSDLLNLFFHDPEDPHHLWSWWKITWVLALMVGMFWMLAISGV